MDLGDGPFSLSLQIQKGSNGFWTMAGASHTQQHVSPVLVLQYSSGVNARALPAMVWC